MDPRAQQQLQYQQYHDYQQQQHQQNLMYQSNGSQYQPGEEIASDDEVAHNLQSQQNQNFHSQPGGGQHYAGEGEEMDTSYDPEHQGSIIEGEEEDLVRDEGEEEEDSGSFSDSLSSSPSIPDEDIDFSLVYALHTFLATVDGQASVVKGDKLLLLDDSNSYWWLVRVLKTQAVGYIPAENIETPWERLARLNKHRNVDLTTATQQDEISGPSSTSAQHRFLTRIPPSAQPHPHISQHPVSKGTPASPSHKDHPRNISPDFDRAERSGSSKAKTVLFTAPTYYEHSANGEETDEEGDEEFEYDEETGERIVHSHDAAEGAAGEQNFEQEESYESEFSDDNLTEEGGMHQHEERQQISSMTQGNNNHNLLQQHSSEAGTMQRALSPSQQESLQRQKQLYSQSAPAAGVMTSSAAINEPVQQTAGNHERTASASDPFAAGRNPSEVSIRGREIDENDFNPMAPTKKLTATPEIVRDPNFDINDPFGDLPAGTGRSISPVRVRGVEVVDPRDPRYNRLLPSVNKRPSTDSALHSPRTSNEFAPRDLAASQNSMETNSSFASAATSDEGHRTTRPNSSLSGQSSKKLRKSAGRDSVPGEGAAAEEGGKKRKSGGILGLFRKKDKKKSKDENGAHDLRSSEDSIRSNPPGPSSPRTSSERNLSNNSKRESQTAEKMFSTDAALRQQQVEAKQAMFQQYGVQRGPNDVTNTMTPRNMSGNGLGLSPSLNSSLQPPQKIRPGSLLGSPSLAGLEVPVLSVLRVFAGDDIESEATFKTVLLNSTTTAADLVKQAMQRFRLAGDAETDQFFLSIKQVGGEERALGDDSKPLEIFEALSEQNEAGFVVPSVKRSSVGSINSIASNLSLNPAITRLGMNDWSDDSAVKFYLNKKLKPASESSQSKLEPEPQSSLNASQGLSPNLAQGVSNESSPGGSPSMTGYRFAAKIIIRPEDLPENVVFDPQSSAIIPRSVLAERQQRNSAQFEPNPAQEPQREKIIFFPRNVNVSEVIEASLDRFGIVDGIVDGGDQVEDRVSKRRSISRVKYSLALSRDGKENFLSASSKLIEHYEKPPTLKPFDRSSKEFRRRSVDATLILGSTQDIESGDPVFIIRRAAQKFNPSRHAGPIPTKIDELEERQQNFDSETQIARSPPRQGLPPLAAVDSVQVAPGDEEILARAASPQATKQDIIAAQRAVSRANQRALLSAQKNSTQGVDINLSDRGTIRSSRGVAADDRVRYSYISPLGKETEITEIVETEWNRPKLDARTSSRNSSATAKTGISTDAESFVTAADTMSINTVTGETPAEEDSERRAVEAVRQEKISIDPNEAGERDDVLANALGARPMTSPLFNSTLQDRLDRVLAKVKEDKAKGRVASPLGNRPKSLLLQELRGAGTPTGSVGSRSTSPNQEGSTQNGSFGHSSPSIDQLVNSTNLRHKQKSSMSSFASTRSSNTTAEQISSARTETTPLSSTENTAPGRSIYRDDWGLQTLLNLVEFDSVFKPKKERKSETEAEDFLGTPESDFSQFHPETQNLLGSSHQKLNDISRRLDQLLLQTQNSSITNSSIPA